MLDDTTQEESDQESCSDATKTKSQDSSEQGGGINGSRNEEAKGQDKLQDEHKELTEVIDPWPICSRH